MKKRLITNTLALVLLISLMTFMPIESGHASDGAWVLVKTQYRVGSSINEWQESPKFPMKDGNDVGSVTGEALSTTLSSWLRSNPGIRLSSQWTWSQPPQVILPGQTVDIHVEANILENTASGGGPTRE